MACLKPAFSSPLNTGSMTYGTTPKSQIRSFREVAARFGRCEFSLYLCDRCCCCCHRYPFTIFLICLDVSFMPLGYSLDSTNISPSIRIVVWSLDEMNTEIRTTTTPTNVNFKLRKEFPLISATFCDMTQPVRMTSFEWCIPHWCQWIKSQNLLFLTQSSAAFVHPHLACICLVCPK